MVMPNDDHHVSRVKFNKKCPASTVGILILIPLWFFACLWTTWVIAQCIASRAHRLCYFIWIIGLVTFSLLRSVLRESSLLLCAQLLQLRPCSAMFGADCVHLIHAVVRDVEACFWT